jgi:predicted XRE-type DNA-binding protein
VVNQDQAEQVQLHLSQAHLLQEQVAEVVVLWLLGVTQVEQVEQVAVEMEQ